MKKQTIFMIEENLHKKFKMQCVNAGASMSQIINALIEMYVQQNKKVK